MGSTSDKVKGVANEAVGNIKQGVGKATDNDRMRAEGVVQEKKVRPSKPWARPRMRSRKALTRRNRPVKNDWNGHPRVAVIMSARTCTGKIVPKSPNRLLLSWIATP